MLPAMRQVLLLLICTAVLVVPAASVAGDSSRRAASKPAQTEPGRQRDTSSPARDCKRRLSGGKGHGAGANAFGKCVSQVAIHRAESEGKDNAESPDRNSGEAPEENSAASDHENSANPAKSCKAIQANDLAHFQTTYGTRPNAFGTCVAKQANTKDG